VEDKKFLISIVGPTAVGKTKLAIELAKHYQTVVLSADSRQFYKEISIGTAKPSAEELNEVQHYFINNKSVSETYSAGDFERDSISLLSDIYKNKKTAILVGGSGLYIKALWEGLDEMPPVNEELRQELTNNYQEHGIEYLQQKLMLLDAHKLENMDAQNPQRLMRAIEIASEQVKFNQNKPAREFEVIKICLNEDRALLYEKINRRVDIMVANGLVDECKQMLPFKNHYALKTVGYTEIFEYLEGKHSLPKAIELIKQHSRNYAKRQITWFKRDEEIKWFLPNELAEIIEFINNKIHN
jgi:tRNA dimethylallyltransferase